MPTERELKEQERRFEGKGLIYLGLGVFGILFVLDYLSKNKHPEQSRDNHNPTQSLQPEADKNVPLLPSAAQAEHNPGNKWYHSNEKREIAIARATKVTLFFFIPYVIVTAGLFAVGIWQVIESKQSTIDDRRAWLIIDHPHVTRYTAEQIGFGAEIKNTGKTPATITKSLLVVSGIFFDRETNCYQGEFEKAIIGPDHSSHILANKSFAVGDQRFQELLLERAEMRFSIQIEYKDIFGRTRHTEVGYRFNGPEKSITAPAVIPVFGTPRMD